MLECCKYCDFEILSGSRGHSCHIRGDYECNSINMNLQLSTVEQTIQIKVHYPLCEPLREYEISIMEDPLSFIL